MPKVRDPNREQAFKIYQQHGGKMDLVEIASQLNLPPGTIRGWKSKDKWDLRMNGTLQKDTERSKQNRSRPNSIDDGTRETMQNEELTEQQKLFCIYYIKTFNAAQSYQKAYGCTYQSAMPLGSNLLRNIKVKAEIERLREIKRQQIIITEDDLVEYHMRIAFADMGNYISFGWTEEPIVTKDGPVLDRDGEMIMQNVSRVTLMESQDVDTQLIKEVKQGRDGISIKLLDRDKSLAWLDRFFMFNPMDRHRMEYDKRKLELELIKLDYEAKKNEPNTTTTGTDNFLDALNAKAAEVWADDE